MGDKVEIEDMTTGGWTADALVNCITDIESGEQRKRHAAGQTEGRETQRHAEGHSSRISTKPQKCRHWDGN